MDRNSREEFYRRYGDPNKSYSRKNSDFFAKFGFFAAKTVTAVITGLLKSVKFILSELLSLGVSILKFFLWVVKELTAPFRERFNINKDMTRKVNKAKKEGEEE